MSPVLPVTMSIAPGHATQFRPLTPSRSLTASRSILHGHILADHGTRSAADSRTCDAAQSGPACTTDRPTQHCAALATSIASGRGTDRAANCTTEDGSIPATHRSAHRRAGGGPKTATKPGS